MTLLRQMWLMLAMSIMVLVVLVCTVTLWTTRSQLQNELSMKNQDTAMALASVLSHAQINAAWAQNLISAHVDTGHFQSITLLDHQKKRMAGSTEPDQSRLAPAWFTHLIAFDQRMGAAYVQKGWQMVGEVQVFSSTRYAYDMLWLASLKLSALLIVAGLLMGGVSFFILRRLNQPLVDVVAQANALADRRRIYLPAPKLPEFRQLWNAMMLASTRLQDWFDEETARVEQLRQQANFDRQTGLLTRNALFSHIEMRMNDDEGREIAMVVTRLGFFTQWQAMIDWDNHDYLLSRLGERLKNLAKQFVNCHIGRISECEFAAFATPQDMSLIANDMQEIVRSVYDPYVNVTQGIWTAYGRFDVTWTLTHALGQLDAVLVMQKIRRNSSVQSIIGQQGFDQKTPEDWRQLFVRAFEQGWMQSSYSPILLLGGGLLHLQCQLRMKEEAQGASFSSAYFMDAARSLGLTSRLDLAAINMALMLLNNDTALAGVAIELSGHSLNDPSFVQGVKNALRFNTSSDRLWLEFEENDVHQHTAKILAFTQQIRPYHCFIGVTHFGHRFSDFSRLVELQLNYLKLDGCFVHHVQNNTASKAFVSGVCTMARHFNMMVIAQDVNTVEQSASLSELGVDGAGGAFVRLRGKKRVSFALSHIVQPAVAWSSSSAPTNGE